jgi:hypothetical protein
VLDLFGNHTKGESLGLPGGFLMLQYHMHGFAVGIGAVLAEAVQDSFEDVANVGFPIDLPGDVRRTSSRRGRRPGVLIRGGIS